MENMQQLYHSPENNIIAVYDKRLKNAVCSCSRRRATEESGRRNKDGIELADIRNDFKICLGEMEVYYCDTEGTV